MNGQDPEFEPTTFGSAMNAVSYLLVHGVIAMLLLLAFVFLIAALIGIMES